jgi:hypothetical protein
MEMERIKAGAELILEKLIIASKFVMIRVQQVDWEGLLESLKIRAKKFHNWVVEKLAGL